MTSTGSPPSPQAFKVEHRTIEFIPESERYGSPRSLFFIWFASNMQITTVVTGALGVILGLSLPWALLALLIGNVCGAVFMAGHSAQGPKLGIPQMIQSRAQFGFYGAILPLVLVLLMYLGFFASSGVLGGSALASWTGMNVNLAIIVVSAICMVLAVYGYRLIHQFERAVSVISGVGFLVLTIRLLTQHHISSVWVTNGFSGGTFLLTVSIAATWQITYAPYVADYSRYLPRATSIRSCFWWTYSGSVIGSVWMMWFGSAAAALAAKAFNGGSVGFVVGLAPAGTSGLFYLVMVLGVIAINVLNLYGAFMSTTTTVTALGRFRVQRGARLGFVTGAAALGTVIAVAGRTNFVPNYTNFILFLAYFLIPWTAVNLVDFYYVRHQQFDIDAIFDPRGRYGRVSWRAMTAYLLGVAVEIPFMSTTFYTGPLVSHLGGADISWIIGLIVTSITYFVLGRSLHQPPEHVEAVATEQGVR
jgi:nucleobase:cation symporter-1, NCS1 family